MSQQCQCGAALHRYGWFYQVAGCYDPAIFPVGDAPEYTLPDRFASAEPVEEDAAWLASYAEAEQWLTRPAWPWPGHDVRNLDGSLRVQGHPFAGRTTGVRVMDTPD